VWDLCELTGGTVFLAPTKKGLDAALEQIAMELRHQYIVGYYPTGLKHDGKWHRVNVSVKQVAVNDPANPGQSLQLKDLKVRTREGYYAPNDTSPNPPRR
jgi:Ca-activated chloride channel homolog